MEQIILAVHLVIALVIIGLIMLQQGKGADMGASFGAGGSQTLFGSDGGGNILTKATAWLVVLFFASSFGLALLVNQRSVVDDDLGLAIPATVNAEAAVPTEEELPVLEDVPAAVTAPAGDDLPQLD
ncbi:MAG: preprotein translocase subunit SecG [Halioglobus sp.]|nr:preprotein translocase subunit SecG [Halioglobus sp.]